MSPSKRGDYSWGGGGGGGARLIEGRLLFEEIRYFVRVWSPRGQIKPKPRSNGSPLGV